MTDAPKTSQQAATELSISPNTLKRWANEFAPFLSPSNSMNGDVGSRQFSADDITVLRRVKHVYGIVPPPGTGLHTLARETGDPALIELVARYGAIVFQDRRLSRRDASRLRQLSRRIGNKKGVAE